MARAKKGLFVLVIQSASAARDLPRLKSKAPRLTRSTATRIDESFFSRRASAGCSSIPMTWLATTTETLASGLHSAAS